MRIVIFISLMIFSLYGSSITVAAAANVGYAMKELTQAFRTLYPNVHVKVIIGSSGKLTAQIQNNAPYDIFLSANMDYAKKIYKSGFAITKPFIYARGKLVLFSTHPREFSENIFILKDPSIKKIAIANPKTAPYGVAAKEALENAGIYDLIKSKFVYGESISQTMVYALRAADIGIVSKSSLFIPSMKKYKKNKNWVDVTLKFYHPIDQGMVILKHGAKQQETHNFYTFLKSKKAKEIFQKFGYAQGE